MRRFCQTRKELTHFLSWEKNAQEKWYMYDNTREEGWVHLTNTTGGAHRKIQNLKTLGDLHLLQNTTRQICEGTPGRLRQCATDIPYELANGVALTHILKHAKTLGALGTDNIWRKKRYPYHSIVHRMPGLDATKVLRIL